MVTDGEVFVVWLQGVLGPTEYDAAVVGVVHAGKEVRVVANLKREMCFDVLEGEKDLFLEIGLVL